MSVNIIELNDHNLRISNDEDTLVESPGFANIAHGSPIFGEDARLQYRLHPRQSFNQFWSQLSLDPLVNTNNHFRHQADLAYGHLKSLSNTADLDDEVVFVIPSNYTRNQLAILLGLVKQCPFDAIGLVDMAVAATSGRATADQVLYVDMQLHQTVLTRLARQGSILERESILQIPGAGLLALHDAWANMITDAFIKQSRFDPLHNAETEQFIYNQLGGWLTQALAGNEVVMEINNKGTIHQAKINRGHFEQKARNILTRIQQEIATVGSADTEIFASATIAGLPGINLYIPGVTGLEEDVISQQCLASLELIRGDPEALGFISSLPGNAVTMASPAGSAGNNPSHLLLNNRAYALENLVYIGPRPQQVPRGKGIAFIETNDLDGTITLSRGEQGYELDAGANDDMLVNGEQWSSPRPLELGDKINFVNSGLSIQLIQVQ